MQSIWQSNSDMPEFPPLRGDVRVEVLVIGGGIAGILTAFFLKKRGMDCLLVEKNRLCGGVTGHTTAKITAQHGLKYHKLAATFGPEKTRRYLETNLRAVEQYAALAKTFPCDFARRDNYVYSVDNPRLLERELRTLASIGYAAELRSTAELPIETAGAVCFPNQAQFHPQKLLAGLAENLRICEHTLVQGLEGTLARTNRGRIQAKKVIVATHFPFINRHGGYFIKLYQNRSYVLALSGQGELRRRLQVNGMYVDEGKEGLSFRNYGDFLLLGGGAHRTGKAGGGWRCLREFAAAHYPGAKEAFAWAAQDCMTLDHAPYIGRYGKNMGEVYVAAGFEKWGMTGAMVAAGLLSDLVSGVKNPDEALFAPSRSILHPQLFANLFSSAANLLSLSPHRCTHMGCSLKWNPAEHTWDCPCHGSRFSEGGEVLENPALRPLPSMEKKEKDS